MAKQTLQDWLREALTDPDKDGPCTAMSLMLQTPAGEREVHTVKFSGGRKMSEVDLNQLFSHKAQGYSQDLPGVQTFWIWAFYAGKNEPQARHPFRVTGTLDFGGDHGMTEPPTETGQRQQGMRLLEALTQGSFRQNAMVHDSLHRGLGEFSHMLVQSQKAQTELLETVKTLVIAQAQDRHAYALEMAKIQRQDMFLSEGMKMLPGVANNLFGREVFPQSQLDSHLLEKFVTELVADGDPKKFEAVASLMSPQLRGLFAQRVKQILENESNKAKVSHETEPAASGQSDPNEKH